MAGLILLSKLIRAVLNRDTDLTTPQFIDAEGISHCKEMTRRRAGDAESEMEVHLLPSRDPVGCAKVSDLFGTTLLGEIAGILGKGVPRFRDLLLCIPPTDQPLLSSFDQGNLMKGS